MFHYKIIDIARDDWKRGTCLLLEDESDGSQVQIFVPHYCGIDMEVGGILRSDWKLEDCGSNQQTSP